MMQFPTTCWGDFNNDGSLDIAMLFHHKNQIRGKSGFMFDQYAVVVFEGRVNGAYNPKVIVKSGVGKLDGILYHKEDNRVEFANFDVASGGFKWNGKKYVVTLPKGD